MHDAVPMTTTIDLGTNYTFLGFSYKTFWNGITHISDLIVASGTTIQLKLLDFNLGPNDRVEFADIASPNNKMVLSNTAQMEVTHARKRNV